MYLLASTLQSTANPWLMLIFSQKVREYTVHLLKCRSDAEVGDLALLYYPGPSQFSVMIAQSKKGRDPDSTIKPEIYVMHSDKNTPQANAIITKKVTGSTRMAQAKTTQL